MDRPEHQWPEMWERVDSALTFTATLGEANIGRDVAAFLDEHRGCGDHGIGIGAEFERVGGVLVRGANLTVPPS